MVAELLGRPLAVDHEHAVAPLVVMSLLFMLVPSLTGSTSFMIIPSGALAIGIAYSMYRKQKKEAEVK